MGKMKEQYFGFEDIECWREVESGALLGLPDARQLNRMSLETIAALPTGTALSSEISICEEGAISVLLKQLGLGWSEDAFLSLLGLAAPSIAPGSRLLMGKRAQPLDREFAVFPDWHSVSEANKTPGPRAHKEERTLTLPKPPATWPWDIKRALATLSAAGGGRLNVTVKNLSRDAQLMKAINDLHEEVVAAGYTHPGDPAVVAGQLNYTAMCEDPGLVGLEVTISAAEDCDTLLNLVAMALFGTLAGQGHSDMVDVDLRLLAGSRQVPDRILPTSEEASALLGKQSFKEVNESKRWCLGQSGGGIDASLSDRDRARHLYVIGATGTGKSTLLKSLILQDVNAGEGVIVFDPHGDLAEDIVAEIPDHRADDIVYADAADVNGRFAVDLLPTEANSTSFEIAADMLVSIFKGSMYAANPEGFGPMFESYFRNALALLAGAPPVERCLANFTRIFDEPGFRRELLKDCTEPSVCGFWRSAMRTGGEASLENITPYITSKLTRFIASKHAQTMFPIFDKCLSFEDIMDSGQILILRCPKGALGEGLSELAMSASLMKIRAAAMARAGHRDRKPVRVYIDEFQNCRGDSLQSLLAEGRKFGISLVLANQSLGQIGGTNDHSVGAATLANVGNLVTFRLGATDALKLSSWLDHPDKWRELCQLPDFQMNARLLQNGKPASYWGLGCPATTTVGIKARLTNIKPVLDQRNSIVSDIQSGDLREGGFDC